MTTTTTATTTTVTDVENGSETTLKKGPWSASEDAVLVEYVNKHGEGNWNAVQRNTGLQRCGKSCRLRWANHLRPNLKKGSFSNDEELLIIQLHSKLGNKWARISSHLPGRTDNEIKNYWNTRVKRRLRQGLPLYPNQNPSNSTQPSKMAPVQPPTFPLNFNKNPTIHNHNPLSLFNPVSLTSSFYPLHHPPPALPPHFLRRCFLAITNGSVPVSLPSQMGQFQFGPRVGFESGQVPFHRVGTEGCNFDHLSNFELPSNQHDQNVTAANQVVVDYLKDDNNNSNMGRTKSGLLDDLLEEAEIKAASRGVKREREDCGLEWEVLTSENSFTGIKKEEPVNQQSNFESEDLSNILDLIPSLVQVPGWCNDSGGESSAEKSASVVSTENNYDGLDKMSSEPPPLPDLSPSDYEDGGDDWNPGSYAWDNMPRIC